MISSPSGVNVSSVSAFVPMRCSDSAISVIMTAEILPLIDELISQKSTPLSNGRSLIKRCPRCRASQGGPLDTFDLTHP